MPKRVLLLTPPFTQPNTPYPATPYLTGFLRRRGYEAVQADLGIELINRVFSRDGLAQIFAAAMTRRKDLSQNALRIVGNERSYLATIGPVMDVLQDRDPSFAHRISQGDLLPKARRFDQLPDLDWAFGNSGTHDKARLLATLYLEDLGDLVQEAVTPWFGFSRYAEKLGLSAHSFMPLDEALRQPDNLLDGWLRELLLAHLDRRRPGLVGVTIPFPGNLYGAFKCGQVVKQCHPDIKVALGGGYANTELRRLSDPKVFDYVDFVTLDDGERPMLNILQFLAGERTQDRLKRTFLRIGNEVRYVDAPDDPDVPFSETGWSDYAGLQLDRYLSLIEIANPMHRLWSDGRWNKMTVAHGCYWHKCSFCDATLDYIKRFESVPATVLADRMEQVMAQTGQSGFHFVDEAAPPAAIRELALELLRRRMTVSWWTNVRFEQAFTPDLCRLLAASGCIAVSGGLETASDRLLALMQKGVTVEQAARACNHFTSAGIMVHAYLMYGFPTQTARETVDSLETVRQFFHEGLIQSAFWHRFTATVHSDVGNRPERYGCAIAARPAGGFALNDLEHRDPSGCDHDAFAPGLRKAVYNFMHGIGMECEVNEWFGFKVPPASVRKNAVELALNASPAPDRDRPGSRVLWIGGAVESRAGKTGGLTLFTPERNVKVPAAPAVAAWLAGLLPTLTATSGRPMTLLDLKEDYERSVRPDFGAFLRSAAWRTLRGQGLLLV